MKINVPDNMNVNELTRRMKAGGLQLTTTKKGYELAFCRAELMCSNPQCPERAVTYVNDAPLCIRHWREV